MFNVTQEYGNGFEQYQVDEFSLGFHTAKSFATTFAQSEIQDEYTLGYVDAYTQRIQPVIENI